MGTEVQSKMYLPGPGYYSIRDLDDNAGNGRRWDPHGRTSKSGQYYDMFLASSSIDGYSGYEKQQLRQTILNHEFIFRNQLHDLHRLYKRQKDLMNEIQCKKLYENSITLERSESNLFPSCNLSDDAKSMSGIQNIPSMDFTRNRPSMLGTASIQPTLSPMKGNIKLADSGPTQNGVRLEDCNSFESRCKKLQRRLFDLEVPADKYIDHDEEQLEERVSRVSGMGSYPLSVEHEVTRNRDVNLFHGSDANSGCNGNSSSSNLRLWNQGLTDLNKPIQVKEASTSVSTDIIGNVDCSKEEVRRQDSFVTSNSSFHFLSNEFAKNSQKGRDGGAFLTNLPLEYERGRKEFVSYNSESEKTNGSTSSCRGRFDPQHSSATYESLQVETRKDREHLTLLPFDQSKTEPQRRTIFGVEISERVDDQSVLPSHTPDLRPLVVQSFRSSPMSSSGKLSNISSQNLVAVHDGSCFNNLAPSLNRDSVQSHEFVGYSNDYSRTIPSCGVELSYKNGICLSLSEPTKPQFCFPSNSQTCISSNALIPEQFEQHGSVKYGTGSGFMDGKFPKNTNVDEVFPNQAQNKLIFQSSVSIDGRSKPEKLHGGLSWLTKPLSSEDAFQEKEGPDKMQLRFLENYSQTFANKNVMENGASQSMIRDSSSRTGLENCSSIGKIFGVPVFDKAPLSNSSCLVSSSAEELQVEDLAMKKKLENSSAGVRHQIDLNLCFDEEEAPSTSYSSTVIVKVGTGIDLEAPIVLETEEGTSCKGESLETQLKRPFESSQNELGLVPHEGLVRAAAEAIVAISSYCNHNPSDDTTCHPSQAPPSDSLHWFADVIISSYKIDLEIEAEPIAVVENGSSCKEHIPKIDYFEFMTLKFTEAKLEDLYCMPQAVVENPKADEEETLPKRPRRGQARRGRQRNKDFQRDVLPGLASLSRHEATEDLHIIEGIIRATGGTWESSMTKRKAAKGSSARGRKRLGASTLIPTVSTICPPPRQEANPKELGHEAEKSLTGWGKRTRRPPRQRCPIVNPPLLVK